MKRNPKDIDWGKFNGTYVEDFGLDEKCMECTWFGGTAVELGPCNEGGPQVVVIAGNIASVWPMVGPRNGCGKFKKKGA